MGRVLPGKKSIDPSLGALHAWSEFYSSYVALGGHPNSVKRSSFLAGYSALELKLEQYEQAFQDLQSLQETHTDTVAENIELRRQLAALKRDAFAISQLFERIQEL